MAKIMLAPGTAVAFSKTVSESDVYLFAGLTGDLAPAHVDAAFMATTPYGERIAHGALVVGYMAAAGARLAEAAARRGGGLLPVSLGYDRIRFVGPALIGDTLTVRYRVARVDEAAGETEGAIEVRNQDGRMVAIASHRMRWQPANGPARAAEPAAR